MKRAGLLILVLLSFSCTTYKWLSKTSGNISGDELLLAPESVVIDGRKLFLKTEMWRDFMPTAGPIVGPEPGIPGSPLIAIVKVTASDTSKLSSLIGLDELWIINGNEIWNTQIRDIPYDDFLSKPNTLVKIARNGPKWKTGIQVDVVVSIHDSQGKVKLLRASNQLIGQAE